MDKQKPIKQIIHLDMDAFYPSVEVLDNPALKGKAVIVGGGKERGVVSSASYEARKYGVHSAQPIARAMRLCPDGIYLSGRMSRYKEISDQVFAIFHRFTPLVEPLSIDEAFLDVTGSIRLFGPLIEIAKSIKQAVVEETGLTISAGIGPSKFVAKIASDMDKPDGLTVVLPDNVREFLNPLSIKKMWGVGKVTRKVLTRLDIHTFKDLSQTPVKVLEKEFGKYGLKMHQLSMGIDTRDVEPHHDAKSIGNEQTFSKDIVHLELAQKELLALANKVARRMRKHKIEGKTITLKVKYSDFVQVTRSITHTDPLDDEFEIYRKVCDLLKKTEIGKRPIRLLGVSVSQLTFPGSGNQLNLFEVNKDAKKQKELHRALDSLYDKHGKKSILPGTLIDK
ncbi:DNA polymerase IV [Thermodesulfobacteriota bacterium]